MTTTSWITSSIRVCVKIHLKRAVTQLNNAPGSIAERGQTARSDAANISANVCNGRNKGNILLPSKTSMCYVIVGIFAFYLFILFALLFHHRPSCLRSCSRLKCTFFYWFFCTFLRFAVLSLSSDLFSLSFSPFTWLPIALSRSPFLMALFSLSILFHCTQPPSFAKEFVSRQCLCAKLSFCAAKCNFICAGSQRLTKFKSVRCAFDAFV